MDNIEVIRALEKQEQELKGRLKALQQTILTLKQINGVSTSDTNVFAEESSKGATSQINDKNKYAPVLNAKTWRDKVVAILKVENRFLHYREIADVISLVMPDVDRDRLKNSISPSITFLKKEGAIVKVQDGPSLMNTFWGSKNWLDSNGKIKPGHEYKKDLVRSGNAKEYEI